MPFQLLIGVCMLALALSLLPARFLGWTNDVAAVVTLPVVPFGHVGTRVRTWLQSGPQAEGSDPTQLEYLRRELDNFRVLYEAERQRAERLRAEIEQLQMARVDQFDVPFDLLRASIVGRNSGVDGETYVLNVGSRGGVSQGAVAVSDGRDLVGRVASVARLTSTLVPVTNPATGWLEAYVAPAEPGSPRIEDDRARTLLKPTGDGTLQGDIERDAEVRQGDLVYLDDPAWPDTARSMIIGRVIAIHQKDQNPLRDQIIVRPRRTAKDLASVTIKVERPAPDGDGP